MVNYADGKIDTVQCSEHPDEIYGGSTSRPLSERFDEHKHKDMIVFHKGLNFHNLVWYLELDEHFPCQREGEVISEIGTLNKRRDRGVVCVSRLNTETCLHPAFRILPVLLSYLLHLF